MAAARSTDTLQVPTLVDELVRRLRELILRGEFAPGERLVEEQLVSRFGVSRPPLREALRILGNDGLITGIPRKGFSVVSLTADDVRKLYDLRYALERTAVELGVPVSDRSRLAPMNVALERMQSDAAQSDPDEMLRANSAFHRALVALPGNRWLDEAYRNLSQQIELCMAMNLKFRQELYNDPHDAVRRHERLAKLAATGKRDALVAALAKHGERSFMDRLDELLLPPVTRT
jgi:DNA-binding GntR family transcriptional regulator